MKYNLARAFQLQRFFVGPPARNLFWYRAEGDEWLTSAEAVIAFLNMVRCIRDAALADEQAVRAVVLARADPLARMMLDDITCAIYNENCPWGQRIVTNAMREQRSEDEKAEAQAAIKDVAIMSIPYKGLFRRLLKLTHNQEVLDALVDERLYVPASQVREHVIEMVFKGMWSEVTRDMFSRMYKVFVTERRWSQRGQAVMAEWDRIIAESRTVSDQRGRIFLEVVEQSIFATGTAA